MTSMLFNILLVFSALVLAKSLSFSRAASRVTRFSTKSYMQANQDVDANSARIAAIRMTVAETNMWSEKSMACCNDDMCFMEPPATEIGA